MAVAEPEGCVLDADFVPGVTLMPPTLTATSESLASKLGPRSSSA